MGLQSETRKTALLHVIKANRCLCVVLLSLTVSLRSPTSMCGDVAGERVMRTTGAGLNNQGSLAKKRAGASVLSEAKQKAQQLLCFPVL